MSLPITTARCLWALALIFTFDRSTCGAADAQESADPRPNVLLINVDDMGWRDCGFMGSDFFETPHLDQLAADSMVFTNAYAGAANCAPSRACLMSGQTTPRHHIFNVGTGPRGKTQFRRLLHVPGVDTLDPKIVTWPSRLQSAGYRTATIGKWHLSNDPRPYGFDVNIGGTHSGGPPRGYYPPHPRAPGLEVAPKNEYLTDRVSEEAIQFIRDSADQPWMLYLPHFAVHTPLQAKRELLEKYENKPAGTLHDNVVMATMIQAVDDGVGRILETLRELSLDQNTVILFTSDNGGYGPATNMSPLKGYKGTYYEGGIRVPLLIHWPGRIEAGSNDQPVTQIDLYPTICELAGTTLPADQVIDGTSLVPILTGESDSIPTRSLFWHFPAYLQSYSSRVDQQRDPLFRSRPCSIIRRGDWKLHEYFEDGGLELYNLGQDPGEAFDLSEQRSDVRDDLHRRLVQWRQQTGAPVPDEPNPDFDAVAEATAISNR